MKRFKNLSEICVSGNVSISQAVLGIEKGACGIILVVDGEGHLVGTVTDGDVRRAMLRGMDFNLPIQKLLEQKTGDAAGTPITAFQGTTGPDALRIMQDYKIRHLPIVNKGNQVVDLFLLDDLVPTNQEGLRAVVLTGNQSEALHPLVENLPKPMLPVGNRPLLEFTISQLSHAGFERVVLTTHYKADTVKGYFGDGHGFGVDIAYYDETENQGLAGVLKNIDASDTPLLVMNGDVLTRVNFNAMLAYHHEHQADMTVAVRLNEFRIPYGVIETQDGKISGATPKPAMQFYIHAGACLLSPDVLGLMADLQPSDMLSMINEFVRAGKRVVSFPIHEYWRDIQVYDDYQQAVSDFRNGLLPDLGPTVARMEPGAPAPAGVIPLSVPEVRGNEWAYIKECLDTNWVSSVGPFVDRFEESVAKYVGVKYGVAASSGTAAIHTALLVAGVGADEEVLLSDLTFIAPANAIRYVGAWPVFIDVDRQYWQMDPEKLADFIQKNCRWSQGNLYNRLTGRKISAIIPVHILGHPCDMEPILRLARQYGLTVIEDATESLGAKYKGQMVGSLGDMACFSFNGNKIITTGGGGMLVTNNEKWAKRAKYLTTQAKDDPIEFVHSAVGYNYRLTNIQAAMGCAQMEQLGEFLQKKREIADRYSSQLTGIAGIQCMEEADWAYSTHWLYTILVEPLVYGLDRKQLLTLLAKNGIQVRPLWQPMHQSPLFRAQNISSACETSAFLQAHALSLPCSVGLSTSDQGRVIEILLGEAKG